MNSSSFFLGANTPDGFYSLFNELYNPYDNWNMYIIKGGPGTGKSSMMKQIAKAALKNGFYTEHIYCSSDPLSLDGLIIPQIKTSIADGTSPHIINPVFPGVCEHTVDLSEYWNCDKLKANSDNIKRLTTDNSKYHKSSVKYLKTASVIENEISEIYKKIFNYEKADRYIKRFCENELIKSDQNNESIRFISAVTPIGIVIQYDTLFNLCDNIITIKDNTSFIADYLLKNIVSYARKNNINRIICPCIMDPQNKTDHIIFPDLKLGLFTSSFYHPMIKKGTKTVNTGRFINKDLLSQYKNKLSFLNKSKFELISESIRNLEKAKSTHDILESYYISAMDFSGVNKKTEQLINQMFHVKH